MNCMNVSLALSIVKGRKCLMCTKLLIRTRYDMQKACRKMLLSAA